jgi:hypothetical protein
MLKEAMKRKKLDNLTGLSVLIHKFTLIESKIYTAPCVTD